MTLYVNIFGSEPAVQMKVPLLDLVYKIYSYQLSSFIYDAKQVIYSPVYSRLKLTKIVL